MADGSHIEWTDATWNPTVGCTKVSPGCDNCYAETFVNRFAGSKGFPNAFEDMLLRPERFLTLPMRWREPRRVFVNSLSDLFHEDVPDDFVAQVFAVMLLSPQHTFQLLTKRHGRMRSLLSSKAFRQSVWWEAGCLSVDGDKMRAGADPRNVGTWPLPNVWLGVSVEDQKWTDIRIPALAQTPAAVRWISAEPLLGPVDLRLLDAVDGCTCAGGWEGMPHERQCGLEPGPNWGGLDWVVVGGESGRGARPMDAAWARSLRRQCEEAGVAFLFKQAGSVLGKEWGCKHPKGGDAAEWPEPFPREYPT